MNESQTTMSDKNYDFFEDYYKRSTEKEKLELSLRFIVEKLNEKSMSAIVGAGFSLNSNPSFPDWANLLVDAYKEMHPKKIRKKFFESEKKYNYRIANEIRQIGEPVVAAEYEKYKGKRESLDIYIENHILQSQNLSQDLRVHESFLQLNWCDVITTNWDNLLENADKKAKYKVVCSAKELKLSNKNRIVKIHGSLRKTKVREEQKYVFDDCSDHLYLITEKDYENYPINHEGFSNFMKVKILENSFCLFGFSGNDWNFRYWVKELKRIMTKGGHTSNLNPIFLFDVSKKSYTSDQKQFFKNNYIIPVKLDDVFDFLGASKSPIISPKTSDKFTYIFDWLLQKKNENDVIKYGKRKLSDNKILQDIAYASENPISKELMQSYIDLPRFEINNLHYIRPFANQIQLLSNKEKQWGKIEYLFLYTWCLNNFFSLTQLFHVDVIERIIKHFIEKKFYLTDAAPFSELIFGYYFDYGKKDDLKRLASLIEKDCEDIVISQKCKYYFKQLEYVPLKETLKNWFPEKRVKINPLHILCKITSLLALENIYESNNDYGYLFETALKGCGENKQLLGFVLLYYRYYKGNLHLEIDSRLTELVNGLDLLDFEYPKRYIDLIINDSGRINQERILPNARKRFQTTTSLSNDNYDDIKYRCFLNFFEYLNLPMEGIISINVFNDLVKKVDEGCLLRMYPYSFYYYGHSSGEEYVQSIVPLFLRRVSTEIKNFLFKKYIDLFEQKVHNKENPQMLCFLMNEIAKRAEKKEAKKYYNLFYELFLHDESKILQNLADNGKMWGISEPFMDYLKQIDERKQFANMLNWVIDKSLMISKNDISVSSYENYYITLLNNEVMRPYLMEFYSDKIVISKLLKSFEENYFLAFDAFIFLNEDTKNACKKFLGQNISLTMNPVYLKECFSSDAKEKIIDIIANRNYRYISSNEWPVAKYIYNLRKIGELNADDLKRITPSIDSLVEVYPGNSFIRDFYKRELILYYEEIHEIYESDDIELKKAVNASIKVLKPIYEELAKDTLDFNWLSSQDGQNFRNSFFESFSYSKTMKKEKELIPWVGLALSKIILDESCDVYKYEAVLQKFISCCYEENHFWFDLFKEDSSIRFSIIQIMKKFKQGIPLCYDDLFIKGRMIELAEIAERMKIEDDVVYYWKNLGTENALEQLS